MTSLQLNEQHSNRRGLSMDKERIKGKAEDVAGRVERQVGEWTGNEKAQAEGLAKQAEGKTRNAVGKVKDSVRDAADKLHEEKVKNENEEDRKIDRDEDENAA
jgi:uncharacterized protein YjbJ (UPF0337 family)